MTNSSEFKTPEDREKQRKQEEANQKRRETIAAKKEEKELVKTIRSGKTDSHDQLTAISRLLNIRERRGR